MTTLHSHSLTLALWDRRHTHTGVKGVLGTALHMDYSTATAGQEAGPSTDMLYSGGTFEARHGPGSILEDNTSS